jgi:SAM-dependent methyltransferase
MRLNVCCGRHLLEGWCNIDVVPSTHPTAAGRLPDIQADARTIPLPDGSATEIMCIHGFEHFYPWEAEDLLKEWYRLLKPRGLLVMEMPNVLKCAKNLIDRFQVTAKKGPVQQSMWGMYGDPTSCDPFMMHKWGWEPSTIFPLLKDHGFIEIAEAETQWHPNGKARRDMRITARRG